MQKKSRYTLWGLLFLFLFLVTSAGGAPPDEKQEELQDIKQKLAREKEILKKTRQKEQATLSKLVVVNKQLKDADKDLRTAKRRVATNKRKIRVFAREISETRGRLRKKGKELKKRIREIYKGRGANYLNLLFSSKTAADFINRSYYFGRVLKRDADLIGALKQEYQKLNAKRSGLKKTNQEVKHLADLIKDKRQIIARAAEEKQKIYEALKERRIEYERRVRELEASSLELEKLITKSVAKGRKAGSGVYKASGKFKWPLRGRLTSRFGYRRNPFGGGRNFHTGIDIAAPYGRSIVAADAGVVIFSGWWDGYGKAVVINHGRSYSTVYGHMSRIYVRKGKNVAKGEVIGLVGTTGYSTGPHLHFEIRKKGKPYNPLRWLP